MSRMIAFHLDENCDPRIARGLRRHGVDVTTTREAGLLKASDEVQHAFATARGRVIITQDADFLRMHAAGVDHAGIVYSPSQGRTIGQVVRAVVQIWELLDPDDMRGRVEFV